MTSSTTETQQITSTLSAGCPPYVAPGNAGIVAGSIVSGVILAALLCLVVFPGAIEPVITGSALLGFGAGWVLLAAWSRLNRSATALGVAAGTGHVDLRGADDRDRHPDRGTLRTRLGVATGHGRRGDVLHDRHASGSGGLRSLAALPPVRRHAALERRRLVPEIGPCRRRLRRRGDVRGRRYDVHLDCRGEGSPTVVAQAGLGGLSAAWARVTPGVEGTTRICAFDRAGQGWSEESSQPNDGFHAASDLHAVLAAAGREGALRDGGALDWWHLRADLRGDVPRGRRGHGPCRQLQP